MALRKGMSGPEVKRWQTFLKARGFLSGSADGVFGEATHRATVEFQRAQGLTPDGVVGSQTMSFASGDEPSVTPAASGAVALTEAVLRQIMPRVSQANSSAYLPFLQEAMEEFEINTPERAAAFLAQLAHESGEFRFMEEIWGPTSAQNRYEPRSDLASRLGNTERGDGKRFKGRGPIQLTGRDNYRRFGELLGVDLVNQPELAAQKEVGFRSAGLYWKKRVINRPADAQDFETVTRLINGGLNGFKDRLAFYERAKKVLGVQTTRAPREPVDVESFPRFSRGLDDPGETTPTAAERSGAGAAAPAPPPRPPTKAAKKPVKKAAKKAAKKAVKKAGAKQKPGAKAGAKKAVKKAAKKTTKAAKKAKGKRGPS